jgi:formiminotetrahydrofolate cyclodeaminase
MAARFTKAREAEDVIEKLARIRTELLPLMDEDAKAYEQYKLKRDLESLKRSADIPLKGVELSIRALRIMQDFKPSCNKNLISDLLCGSIMVAAGANGCRLNVMVNINSMKDESLREEYKRILGRLEEELKGALGIEGLRFD